MEHPVSLGQLFAIQAALVGFLIFTLTALIKWAVQSKLDHIQSSIDMLRGMLDSYDRDAEKREARLTKLEQEFARVLGGMEARGCMEAGCQAWDGKTERRGM